MQILTKDNETMCLSARFISNSHVLTNMENCCTNKEIFHINISKHHVLVLEEILDTHICRITNKDELYELINLCDFFCIDKVLPIFLCTLVRELYDNYLKNKEELQENISI